VRYDVPATTRTPLAVDFYRDDTDFWIHHHTFGIWLVKSVSDRRISADQLSDAVVSPMPGVVVAVNVEVGDHVKIGDPLVVIEAMKMEHIVRARRAGIIARCNAIFGAKVRVGELLIEVVEDV
jgi:biotin carboxyl carrier protein